MLVVFRGEKMGEKRGVLDYPLSNHEQLTN
jgi:hypothetical protein